MALVLETGDVRPVHMRAVVLFSALDHFSRRSEGASRVVGALVGDVSNSTVELTNCFPIPLEEKEDGAVMMGTENHEDMLRLHGMVSPREKVVGWYTVHNEGMDLGGASSVVAEFFRQRHGDGVVLSVDASFRTPQLHTRAYKQLTLDFVKHSVAAQFQQVPLELKMTEEERIGVAAMTEGTVLDAHWSGEVKLATELDRLVVALQRLQALLDASCKYARLAAKGEVDGDVRLGTKLAAAVSTVPHVDGTELAKSFTASMRDVVMISQLTKLTQDQLAIAERMNTTA